VAEGVETEVELVHPVEIAVGHLDRAHLLAAYGRGELDGRLERVNQGAHHELSFLVRDAGLSVAGCPGRVLDKCRAGALSREVARNMATCDLSSRLVTLRRLARLSATNPDSLARTLLMLLDGATIHASLAAVPDRYGKLGMPQSG
jgi:hypothetical protein